MNTASLFQSIPCPLCGADDFSILKKSGYPDNTSLETIRQAYSASSSHKLLDQVVQCRRCTMQYVNPRPKDEIIIDSYSSAEDDVFVAQNPQRIHTFRKFLSKVVTDMGWKDGSGRKFLDVGCAGGASLVAARSLGFEPRGIEPSRWMADFGRREYNVDIRDGILVDGLFEPNTFDILTMWDVLEHVPDPNQILNTIHTILKPGGLFVMTFPDVGSWLTRMLGDRWPFWLSVHLLYYTPTTIRKQLEQGGFEVRSINPYLQTLQLDYVLERGAPYLAPLGWFRPLVQSLGMTHMPITYYLGQTFVIARKPAR